MSRIFLILVVCFSVSFSADAVSVQTESPFPIIDIQATYPWSVIRSECLPPTEKDPAERCTVKKVADLGAIGDRKFTYALYEWLSKDEAESLIAQPVKYPKSNTVVVLFYSTKESPNMLRPFYADRTDLNTGWFEEPRIVKGASYTLLQIPHRGSGTTNVELDEVLIWKESEWHMLDTQSWVEDLHARLPEGCSVLQETPINYESMKASNYLWREKDQECCPSCGRFSATFGLENDRLVLKSLSHDMKAKQ